MHPLFNDKVTSYVKVPCRREQNVHDEKGKNETHVNYKNIYLKIYNLHWKLKVLKVYKNLVLCVFEFVGHIADKEY